MLRKRARHNLIRLRDIEEGKIEHALPAVGKEPLLLKPESRYTSKPVIVDEERWTVIQNFEYRLWKFSAAYCKRPATCTAKGAKKTRHCNISWWASVMMTTLTLNTCRSRVRNQVHWREKSEVRASSEVPHGYLWHIGAREERPEVSWGPSSTSKNPRLVHTGRSWAHGEYCGSWWIDGLAIQVDDVHGYCTQIFGMGVMRSCALGMKFWCRQSFSWWLICTVE